METAVLHEDLVPVPAGGTNPFLANLNRHEIPSLYGLRGVAALAVVIWHFLLPWNLSYLFPGPYAVTMFFELSGLLITWLLLKKREQGGRINKGQFYSRRALRLFPVFYVVWGLCRMSGPFAGRWAYFFYLGDYYTAVTHRYGPMTAAWSLGVEEKFYLIWPLLLTRVETRKLRKILIAVLICEPAYRLLLSSLGYGAYVSFAFDTHLDAILLGCLLAILARRGWRPPAWVGHPVTPFCALLCIFVLQRWTDVVIYLLAVILVGVICRPPRLLNNAVMRYLGLISYSLYLCHEYAATDIWRRLLGHFSMHSMLLVLSSQLVLAIALASALHFVVERPFLKVKRRLHSHRA